MIPVVALNAPENGMMVVVEIAYGLDCLKKQQKGLAYEYFPKGTELSRESTYD